MGAAASTALGTITRAQVAEKTRSTREMLDFIFHYLMEDIHIRDFYRLSSPDECKRYILILANRIHENFLSLDIVPSRTKAGKLYYRSVHDHVSPPTEAEKTERQTLCVVLAFFYVRIFQIFGSLALTLVDDATTMPRVARGVARVFETGAKAAVRPAIGRVGDAPVPFRGRMVGGADKPDLGQFKFIPLRDKDPRRGRDGNTYYVINTVTYTAGIQIPSSLLIDEASFAQLYIQLKKPVTIYGNKIDYAVATMKLTSKGLGSHQLSFKNELTVPGRDIPRMTDFNAYMKTAMIKQEGLGEYTVTMDGKAYHGAEIGKIFDIFGERLEAFLKEQIKGHEEGGYYTGDGRPAIGVDGVRYGYGTGYDAAYKRPGLSTYLLADEKVPQGMRITSLYRALTTTRPLPSCVSRAIQLLTTMPSGGMGPALTSICDNGFLAEDIYKPRAGVPLPGESMEKSPGEMALVQLFYDTVSKATRDSLEQSPGALKDYTTFMRAMAAVYGTFKGKEPPSDFSAVTPSEIKDKHMQLLCSKLSAEGSFALSDTVARSVVPYVQQLLRQQLAHAAAAGKILSKLFSIDARRQIRLNPKLLDGGFPALEAITAETRQLLTAYYARCEETYRKGVGTMVTGIEGEKAAAATAAAERAAAARAAAAAPVAAKPVAAAAAARVPTAEEITMEGILKRQRELAAAAAPPVPKRPETIVKRVGIEEKARR
jgi:hypothetical protein